MPSSKCEATLNSLGGSSFDFWRGDSQALTLLPWSRLGFIIFSLTSSSLFVLTCFTPSRFPSPVSRSLIFALFLPVPSSRHILAGRGRMVSLPQELSCSEKDTAAVPQRSNLLWTWKKRCLSPSPAGWSVSCQCALLPHHSDVPFHSILPCSFDSTPSLGAPWLVLHN